MVRTAGLILSISMRRESPCVITSDGTVSVTFNCGSGEAYDFEVSEGWAGVLRLYGPVDVKENFGVHGNAASDQRLKSFVFLPNSEIFNPLKNLSWGDFYRSLINLLAVYSSPSASLEALDVVPFSTNYQARLVVRHLMRLASPQAAIHQLADHVEFTLSDSPDKAMIGVLERARLDDLACVKPFMTGICTSIRIKSDLVCLNAQRILTVLCLQAIVPSRLQVHLNKECVVPLCHQRSARWVQMIWRWWVCCLRLFSCRCKDRYQHLVLFPLWFASASALFSAGWLCFQSFEIRRT